MGTGVGDGVWIAGLLRVLDWVELDGAGRMTLRGRSAGVGIGVRGVEGYEGCIGGLVGIVLEVAGGYGVSRDGLAVVGPNVGVGRRCRSLRGNADFGGCRVGSMVWVVGK